MQLSAYISGAAVISKELPDEANGFVKPHNEIQLPDFSAYIPTRMSRRMSPVIKFGIYTGKKALEAAGIEQPQAIIFGTAMGCIKDTEIFLSNLVREKENLLSPTAFIQSTHNTIAGQLALSLQCSAYNFTYVQRFFSFESALLDALLMIQEGKDHVLAGAADELTPTLKSFMDQVPHFKPEDELGEGAAAFVLSNTPKDSDWAEITDLQFFRKGKEQIRKTHKPDVVLINDLSLTAEVSKQFPDAWVFPYTAFSGTHYIQSSQGMYYGIQCLQNQMVYSMGEPISMDIENLTVWTRAGKDHSLISLARV